MKKVLTLIYVLATLAFSIYAVFAEIQPALFWMNLFAPNIGDTYPVFAVGGLTFLTFLLPLVLLLILDRIIRKKKDAVKPVDGPGIWIMRKRQLQSALVEIPIYINDVKMGGIDSGTIKFFEAPLGRNTVIAGKGMTASEKVEFNCSGTEQPYFKLEITQSGLVAKNVLYPMAPTDSRLK